MKIIFIDPGFGEKSFQTFGQSYWSSIIQHGLCSISAYAKSRGFSDIELIDFRKLRNWDEFQKIFKAKNPQVVSIPMRSCDFNTVIKILEIIKKINKKIITVVGGVHPTVAPQEVIALPNIDHIIIGEGEISFTELLQAIQEGRPRERVITGIKPNLDELPFDDRELYDYKVTISLPNYPGIFKPPMVTMIGSRGCPFRCTFCAPHAKTMFGLPVRFRNPEHIIKELRELKRKYNFKSIKFYDYSFTLNPKWVERFSELYEKEKFGAEILAQSRSSLICAHPELLPKLKRIGLKMMMIGFESGSQRVLDFLKKDTAVEQNIKAARLLKENGIMISGSFMLGTPHETKEDVRATIDLVKTIKPHFVSVSYFTPCPGSELYEYCQKNNLSLLKSYDELTTYAPSTPKIKGVDYNYLSEAVEEILGTRFGGKFMGKLIRFIYIKTKKYLGLRHFLISLYSRWVRSWLYRRLVK